MPFAAKAAALSRQVPHFPQGTSPPSYETGIDLFYLEDDKFFDAFERAYDNILGYSPRTTTEKTEK